jgi:hypothetical protein
MSIYLLVVIDLGSDQAGAGGLSLLTTSISLNFLNWSKEILRMGVINGILMRVGTLVSLIMKLSYYILLFGIYMGIVYLLLRERYSTVRGPNTEPN